MLYLPVDVAVVDVDEDVSSLFVETSSEFELHVTNPGEWVVSGISSRVLLTSWPLVGGT